jgi:hypothetical protein
MQQYKLWLVRRNQPKIRSKSRQQNEHVMSPKTDTTKAVLYNYIKDWRNVEGKWIYVPLHHSVKGKLNAGFTTLIVANILREASRLLVHVTFSAKVNKLAKAYASKVSERLIGAWEEDCPIYPANWPYPQPPPYNTNGNDPDPIFHATTVLAGIDDELPGMAKNELVGFTLHLIGETVGDKSIATLGKDIVMSGAALTIDEG